MGSFLWARRNHQTKDIYAAICQSDGVIVEFGPGGVREHDSLPHSLVSVRLPPELDADTLSTVVGDDEGVFAMFSRGHAVYCGFEIDTAIGGSCMQIIVYRSDEINEYAAESIEESPVLWARDG